MTHEKKIQKLFSVSLTNGVLCPCSHTQLNYRQQARAKMYPVQPFSHCGESYLLKVASKSNDEKPIFTRIR